MAKWLTILLAVAGQSEPPSTGSEAPSAPPDRARYGQVVDLVVAEVGDEIITLSELIAETGWVLARTRGLEVALEGGLPRSLLRSVLESMVNSQLLLQEVRRLQLEDIEQAAVDAEFERFARRFASKAQAADFYESFGFEQPAPGQAPPLLERRLRIDLRVERFLEVRLDAKVDLELVQRCLREERRRFEDVSPAQARRRVTERLRAQLRERALKRILSDLQDQTQVVFTPGYGPIPGTGPEAEFSCPLPES